jgi:hypothetical protein
MYEDSLRDGGRCVRRGRQRGGGALLPKLRVGPGARPGRRGGPAAFVVCGRASRPSRYSCRHRARPNMVPYIWFP